MSSCGSKLASENGPHRQLTRGQRHENRLLSSASNPHWIRAYTNAPQRSLLASILPTLASRSPFPRRSLCSSTSRALRFLHYRASHVLGCILTVQFYTIPQLSGVIFGWPGLWKAPVSAVIRASYPMRVLQRSTAEYIRCTRL